MTRYSLEPFFDGIKGLHWNRIDDLDFPLVVFEDYGHVAAFQVKLDSFEMHEFDVVERHNERRLNKNQASL